MATPLFARQDSAWGGSFSSDTAAMFLDGDARVAIGIVQNANITFTQNVSRIYDVSNGGIPAGAAGVVPVYLVGGRTQGNATIGRVIGPGSGDLCAFYTTMGDVCDPKDLSFTFAGGCGKNGTSYNSNGSTSIGPGVYETSKYGLQRCVLTSVGIQVNSNDMIVNESVQLMFINMTCGN